MKDCKNDAEFFSKWKPILKQKQVKKKLLYLVPLDKMTDAYRSFYAETAVEYDEDGEAVEDILGDISSSDAALGGLDSLPEQLVAARLENINARTKYINERLEQKKHEMFIEWTEKIYDAFTGAFGKFKNALVELHLDEEKTQHLELLLGASIDALKDAFDKVKNGIDEGENEEQSK